MKEHKILLIEDDRSFGYILTEYLQMQDFTVDWAQSGEEGLALLENQWYNLVILDIMLPDKNGFEVATELRQRYPNTAFIFLSALTLKIEKLKGYQLGAYDYVTKPIDEEVLVAKIRALLRGTSNYEKIPEQKSIHLGEYLFEPELQRLSYRGDIRQLTQREAELLSLFCEYQNKLLPRDLALRSIWQSTDEFSRKSMDVFVSHLRKYLAKDARIQIKNIHGKGFVLVVGEE